MHFAKKPVTPMSRGAQMTIPSKTSLLVLTTVLLLQNKGCEDKEKKSGGDTSPVVASGTQACSPAGAPVWEVGDGTDTCDAMVEYSGTKSCKAYFDDPNSADAKSKQTQETSSGDVLIKGVKKLTFHCNGETGAGECKYTIKQLKCGTGMTNEPVDGKFVLPACHESKELLKAPHAGTKCNVTVEYTGKEGCEAGVWTMDDHHLLDSTITDTKLRTFQGIDKQLHAACLGDKNGGCSFKVKQVECTP